MDDRLSPHLDDILEDALRSQPVIPMPRSITGDVMAHIQGAMVPRFQFTRNDYLLTLVLIVVFSSIIFGLQFIPGHIVLQLRIQGILIWQSLLVNARGILPVLFFGLAALLAGLTLPSLYKIYKLAMDDRP